MYLFSESINQVFFFFFSFLPSLHKICIISFLLQIPSFFNNATVYFCSHSVFVFIVFLRSVVAKFNQHSCHKWKTLGNREKIPLAGNMTNDGWMDSQGFRKFTMTLLQWLLDTDPLTYTVTLKPVQPVLCYFTKTSIRDFFTSCILQVKEMTTSS